MGMASDAEMVKTIDAWIRYLVSLRAAVAAGQPAATYRAAVAHPERGRPSRRADR